MPRSPRLRPLTLVLAVGIVLAVAGVALWARGGDDEAAATTGGLEITDVTMDWPANPTVAAVHLEVHNRSAEEDALVGASTPIASSVMVHRTDVDEQGRAVMTRSEQVPIAPRSTVTFDPGGLHVMVSGIDRELEIGDEVPLDLIFREAGVVRVTAVVVEPSLAGEHGGDHEEAGA